MKNACLILSLLLIISCCKPPDVEMESIHLPNTYTGLDSLYARMEDRNGSITIVCYGNSITYGASVTSPGQQVAEPYPAFFQDHLQQWHFNTQIQVINEGHSGWTVEMAAGGLDSLVLVHQPDFVTLIYGINDLYQGEELSEYEVHLTTMIQALKQRNITVLVMSPTPLYNHDNKRLLEFCSSASRVAQQNGVAFFHMHQAMVNRIYLTTDDPSLILPDEVHYSDAGYRLIGEELMKYWMQKP